MLPANYRPDPLLPDYLEQQRQASVLWLGERWLLHPANAPAKGNYSSAPAEPDDLTAAVAAAVAAEREACAKVCDGWTHADGDDCAAAIRARKDR